jgi:polyhydroxybutyrate depolymerase
MHHHRPLASRIFFISIFVLQTCALSRAAETPLVERKWQIEDVERKALLAIPDSAHTTASPLVFVFHGHGGSMQNVARSFGIHRIWPEAIVVYMQGLPTPGALTDPQGKLPGWQKLPGDQNDRDLKFFDAVLKTIRDEQKVDEKRIYCTGHSNGGAFTYLLWAERGDIFAAVAPSAAAYRRFQDLKPKPALHIAGQNDQLVAFSIQQRMMDVVKKLNGCSPTT